MVDLVRQCPFEPIEHGRLSDTVATVDDEHARSVREPDIQGLESPILFKPNAVEIDVAHFYASPA